MLAPPPPDMTPFAAVLQGIGFLHWLLAFIVLALVLIKVKSFLGKIIGVGVVFAVFVYFSDKVNMPVFLI